MVLVAVALSAVIGFVLSGVLYAVLPSGPSPAAAPPERPTWQVLAVELVRNAAVAGLVAGLLGAGRWSGAGQGALLGLGLAVLPVVLLVGSAFHEGTPLARATTHAVDWLVKLPVIGVVVGLVV